MRRWTLTLLACLVLCGCQEQTALYNRLEEEQANEVLAALLRHGIASEKIPGEEGTWNVTVDKARFSEAMEILKRRGLPNRTFVGIGEVFKKTGMVSSPTEERIRYMYALSQDLSATLNEITGVISARVHVVLPENDPFDKAAKPSSASVFIKHDPAADLESQVPFIKNLVKDGIEGLEYDKISVVLFPGEASPEPETLAVADGAGSVEGKAAALRAEASGSGAGAWAAVTPMHFVLFSAVFAAAAGGGGLAGWWLRARR